MSPTLATSLRLPILATVVSILTLQPTLGATLETALHIGSGSALGVSLAAVAVSVLPASFGAALSVGAVFAIILGLTEIPPAVKRFAVGLALIILLIWGAPTAAAPSEPVDAVWAARLALSAALGIVVACAYACVPLGVVMSAREAELRLRRVHVAHARALKQVVEMLRERRDANLTDARLGAIALVMNHGVLYASGLQRFADVADLQTQASVELTMAGSAIRVAAFEPREWSCCRTRKSITRALDRTTTIASAARLHRTLNTALAALSEDSQSWAQWHWRDAELRIHLAALAEVSVTLLLAVAAESKRQDAKATFVSRFGTAKASSSVQAAAAAVRTALISVSVQVDLARRSTLYENDGHVRWHSSQLWAPFTFAHSMLQVGRAALVIAEPTFHAVAESMSKPHAASQGLCSVLSLRRGLHACFRAMREQHRILRAARLACGVVIAACAAVAAAPLLSGGLNPFWAPVTVAFVAGGSEAGSFRTTVQRLQGTLLGSSAGLVIALLCDAAPPGVIITLLALWSGALHFYRPGGLSAYWASVAAVTAPIIALGGGGDKALAQNLALGRMGLTWIGLAAFFFVTAIIFPTSARHAVFVGHTSALKHLAAAVTDATGAYTDAVTLSSAVDTRSSSRLTVKGPVNSGDGFSLSPLASIVNNHTPGSASVFKDSELPGMYASRSGLTGSGKASNARAALVRAHADIDAVHSFLARAPAMLDEAAYEPQLWHLPFTTVSRRYIDLAAAISKANAALSLIHDATLELLENLRQHDAINSQAHYAAQRAQATTATLQQSPERSDSRDTAMELRKPLQILTDQMGSLTKRISEVLRLASTNFVHSRTTGTFFSTNNAVAQGRWSAEMKLLDAEVALLTQSLGAYTAGHDSFLHSSVAVVIDYRRPHATVGSESQPTFRLPRSGDGSTTSSTSDPVVSTLSLSENQGKPLHAKETRDSRDTSTTPVECAAPDNCSPAAYSSLASSNQQPDSETRRQSGSDINTMQARASINRLSRRAVGPAAGLRLVSNSTALSVYAVSFALRELVAATIDVVRGTR